MAQDERDDAREAQRDQSDPLEMTGESELEQTEEAGEAPLVQVRYGLGKELLLYQDSLEVVRREEAGADHFALAEIRRLILTPGDPNPSKLLLMLELDDGSTIIAAEGMSNVPDFRRLLGRMREVAPHIELDPPDMDTQLGQALDIRRRSLIGCYGTVIGVCVLLWLIYLALAYMGAHAGH